MSLVFRYVDPNGAWSVDLGSQVVRLGVPMFNLSADLGATEESQISFDDPSGTVGHNSDAITGWKLFLVDELACSSGNQRLYAALFGAREYTHAKDPNDSLRVGVSRHIEAELLHINEMLSLRHFTDSSANRPAESVSDRMTWVMGRSEFSDYVSTTTTYVASASNGMDANDYRPDGTSMDVIASCCLAAGYNAFLIFNDEATTKPLLFFDDFKTSTAYTTSHRLSNVAADIDSTPNGGVGATKTWSLANSKLRRDPSRVGSTVIYKYRKGWTSVTNSTTATNFIGRDLVAPDVTVKTGTTATSNARRLLGESSSEMDTLSGTVTLPAANVNDIREGHRISVKDRTAPGYSGFNDWRVVHRTPRQTDNDAIYELDLVMAPVQPTITCDDPGNVNLNVLHGTVTGYTTGASLGTHTNLAAPTTPANMNDNDIGTVSDSTNSQIEPQFDGPYYVGWISDLGAAYAVPCMAYYDGTDHIGTSPVPDTIEYSTDNATWHTVAYTAIPNTPSLGFVRWVFNSTITARYWRISFAITNQHNLPYGFGYWPGITGAEWRIMGQ